MAEKKPTTEHEPMAELDSRFISIAEAAKTSGRTAQQLSLLCRKGTLRGEERDGEWYTTREWLNEFLYVSPSEEETAYIPLSKAAQISGYTSEHLNLLCRRGILRGKKLGRNWHTTREWLNEFLYAAGPDEKNHYVKRRKKLRKK